MINWVRVAGYKCLHEVEVEAGPFNVLIGRNDSGKSSFLEALSAPGCWFNGQPGRFGQLAHPGSELRMRRACAQLLVQRDRNWEVDSVVLVGSQPWTAQDRKRYLPFITTQPVSLDPPAIAASSQRGSGGLNALIASRGQGTAAYLASIALGDRTRYETIQTALRESTQGRVREFVVKEAGADYALHYRLYDGTLIPARDVSQGILVLTCFLAIVHRDDAPSALLIEEPENGVHPLRLKEIVDLLRSLTERGTQIFLTTHSPDLLSWCKPEEVLVFWRPEPASGTEIHRLSPDFQDKIALGEPLGQVWASRGEEGLLDLLAPARPFVREPAP
jgi:hypothetical protein